MATFKKFKDLVSTTTINNLLGAAENTDGVTPGNKFTYSSDTTMAGNSDIIVSTQKAVKTYVDDSNKSSNVVLIDQSLGNDSSGVVGSLSKPFLTYNAAKALISTQSITNQFNILYSPGTHTQLGTALTPYINIVGTDANSAILRNGIDITPDITVDVIFNTVDGEVTISHCYINNLYLNLSTLTTNRKSAIFNIDGGYFHYASYVRGREYSAPTIYPDKLILNNCSSDPTCANSFACGYIEIKNSSLPFYTLDGRYGDVSAEITNSNFSDTLQLFGSGAYQINALVKGCSIKTIEIDGTQAFLTIDSASLAVVSVIYSGGATVAQITSILSPGGLRSVADNTARNAIPIIQRQLGMEVITLNNYLKYRLINEPTTPGTTDPDWETTNIKLVGDNIFIDGVNEEINLTSKLSTGLISGGDLSVNGGDNTKFDVAAGKGVIIDRSDQDNPTFTIVSWIAKTAQTDPFLATNAGVFVGVDNTGSLVIQVTDFTAIQIRSIIRLGRLSHFNRTTITGTYYFPVFYTDDIDQAYQSIAFGTTLLFGGNLSANGANLKLNKSQTICRRWGANARISIGGDLNDPHTPVTPGDSSFSFLKAYRAAGLTSTILSSAVTDLDPTQYDDGSGTLQSVTALNYTIQTIILFPAGNIQTVMCIYGQVMYTSLSQAQNKAPLDYPVILSDISGAVIIGRVIIRQDVTDLSAAIIAGTAQILGGTIFGTSSAGGGGGGAGTVGFADITGVPNDNLSLSLALASKTSANVVPNTLPTAGQILAGNAGGTAYAPVSMNTDATLASTGALTIANNAITNAKAAQMGSNTYKGNATGSTANAADIATNTAFNKNFSTSNPNMDGTAAAGSTGNVSDGGHIHPTDTSRATAIIPLNNQTDNYTLVLTDSGKLVEINAAIAKTITVPLNSSVLFPVGTIIAIMQQGVGKVTVAGEVGVTIRTPATLNIRAQYAGATLLKRATDEWYLTGELETV